MTLLSLSNVSYYFNLNDCLADVTLDLDNGGFYALLGPSGVGKSTLVKLIKGQLKVTSGEITFNNITCTYLDLLHNPTIQLIPQNPYQIFTPKRKIYSLFSEYLLRYCNMSSSQVKSHLEKLSNYVGMTIDQLHRIADDYSVGELQRLALMRALLCEPKLIICDETVSALDLGVQELVISILKHLNQINNITVLFVTHDLVLVREHFEKYFYLSKSGLSSMMTTDGCKDSQKIINQLESLGGLEDTKGQEMPLLET